MQVQNYIGIVLFFVCSLLPYVADARVSYSATPLVVDEKVEARDILTRDITITNNGDAPVTIFPTVNNISLDEGGTIQEFKHAVESDRTTSLASWLEISRKGINLMIGDTVVVPLTIRVNPNPKPGTYHAFVGFGYGGTHDNAVEQVSRGEAPGVIVSVTIEEQHNELLKLSRFIIDRFITNTENQAAVYKIKNPGDEPLAPTGDIIFYDNHGVEVGSLSVNADNVVIPAGGEHEFTAQVPVSGLFGKYKAFLNVEYGSSQLASVQDTSFFYVFPLKKLLLIFGVMSVVFIIVALFVHRRYFSEHLEEADTVHVHVRNSMSEPQHHDIDLKNRS